MKIFNVCFPLHQIPSDAIESISHFNTIIRWIEISLKCDSRANNNKWNLDPTSFSLIRIIPSRLLKVFISFAHHIKKSHSYIKKASGDILYLFIRPPKHQSMSLSVCYWFKISWLHSSPACTKKQFFFYLFAWANVKEFFFVVIDFHPPEWVGTNFCLLLSFILFFQPFF